jgi:transcriptional antiterminator RfaH
MKNQPFEAGVRWYCVRTKPKKERMAAANLEAMLSLEVFCPQIRFRRKTARGPVWFQEAMFPGYLFCRFDMGETKRAVSHAPGVLNIPVFGGRVVPIPEEVIDSLRNEVDDDGIADVGMPHRVGDETTVLEGSMRGLRVKIIKVMPAEDRVAVLLEMLGTLVEAEFPTESLEQKSRHKHSTKI